MKFRITNAFRIGKNTIFAAQFGEMAERSIAAVLKTVEGNTSGGSNPSLSAEARNSIRISKLQA